MPNNRIYYFHYTSIEALYNIIKSKKVWFSSLSFMNDPLEGMDLYNVMSDALGVKNNGDNYDKKMFFVESVIQERLRHQLAFCATTLRDDISQWRAYTQLGQGVCICFQDGIFNANVKKLDCIYDEEEKRKEIIKNRYLGANEKELLDIFEEEKEGNHHKGLHRFVGLITETLVRFKNQSFSPEKETRWVFHVTCVDDARFDIKFRPHQLGLNLYQEVEIDLKKISLVTLGPQVPPQNKRTIEDFLKVNNCKARVDCTKVSLR